MWLGLSSVYGKWSGFSLFRVIFYISTGLYGGGLVRLIFLVYLFFFFFFRIPFFSDYCWLFYFLMFSVMTLFFSAALFRFKKGGCFLREFLPDNVNWFFGFFVFFCEFFSYVARPFSMMFRPLVKVRLGIYLIDTFSRALCYWYMEDFEVEGYWLCCLLFGRVFFWFYEWCVSCVQWYILKELIIVERET